MFKIYDGRDSFYQWDTERKLIVNDASITEVHFSDAVESEALVCEVYDFEGVRVANVPNILLQTEWKINAYAFTDKHTKVSASFKVLPRSKPSDYVYTETEVKTYEEIIEKVNSLPFKELVAKQNYYLQELEEGIYIVTNEGTTSNTTVILGTNDNKLTMKKGSILIVSNNTTISNINRSFKKHFIALVSHTVPNSNYIKSGELYCKSVTVEGIKDWEYEITWGDLLHSGNIAEYVENVLEGRLEEVAESIGETVESITVNTDNKLAEFKERELDYTRLYYLPRKQMEETNPTNLANRKLFSFTPTIQEWSMDNTRGKKIKFDVDICTAKGIYDKENNTVDISYTLQENNPFNVEDLDGILTLTNTDEFIDVAIVVGKDVMFFEPAISSFLEDIGENLTEIANLSTNFISSRHTVGNIQYSFFNYSMSFWIPDEFEGVAEALYEELVTAMTYYNNNFVLKVKNIPEIEEVSSTMREGF